MTTLPFIPAGGPDEQLLTRLFGEDDYDGRQSARAFLRSLSPAILDANYKPVMLAESGGDAPPAKPGNIADVIAALAGTHTSSPLAEGACTTTQTQPAGTNSDGGGVSLPLETAAPVPPPVAPPAAVSFFTQRGLPGLTAWLLKRLVPIEWRMQ